MTPSCRAHADDPESPETEDNFLDDKSNGLAAADVFPALSPYPREASQHAVVVATMAGDPLMLAWFRRCDIIGLAETVLAG
jgi:hypothetical protein